MISMHDDPNTEFLGIHKIGNCTIERFRMILPKEEVQENILGVKKVLAKYEADVLEKYQLTPEEIAWRNAKKKEAFHLIEAGEMDKAKVIYAEIKDRLDAKLMSVK